MIPATFMTVLFQSRAVTRRNITLLMARILIALVAVFHGWVSYAGIVSASHDPAVWSVHGQLPLLAEADDDEHGHPHDGADGQAGDGHQHGHNAADHSHDKPNVPRGNGHPVVSPTDVWLAAHPASAYASPHYPFERPPRTVPTL